MGAMAEGNAKGLKPSAAQVVLHDAELSFVPSTTSGPAPDYGFESDGFRQSCPRCYALLAKQVQAGKPRDTATIRFFADAGRLKVAVNDRQTGQTFWTTLDATLDPFVELEAALVSGKGEWRKDKPLAGRR